MNLLESIAPFDCVATALAQDLLGSLGVNVTVKHLERLPPVGPLMIVSNHRSFLDPLLLTSFLNTPIHFVCHRYMANVPVLRELLQACGGFPLSRQNQDDWYPNLLQDATNLLDRRKTIGIFPEGVTPMLNPPATKDLRDFHRGFAHLALQATVPNLQILPVAICAPSAWRCPVVPLRLLHQLDPFEPGFNQAGWHPAVFYRDVVIRVGQPLPIAPYHSRYHGRAASILVRDITAMLSEQIAELLAAA
jgi:1-acyl-sn-glycerol-3-phosphate acyltransferase